MNVQSVKLVSIGAVSVKAPAKIALQTQIRRQGVARAIAMLGTTRIQEELLRQTTRA